MNVRWILVVLVCGALAAQSSEVPLAAAYTPPAGSPLAKGDHPRLFLTAGAIPGLRTKLASEPWRSELQRWVTWLDDNYTTLGGHANAANYALVWLTHPVSGISYGHTREQYGGKARGILVNGPVSFANGLPTAGWGYPVAYDWINPLLSAQHKATLLEWFKQTDTISGNLLKDTNVFNTNNVTARAQKVLAALAVYGDGADDNAWAQASVDKYIEFFRGPGGVTFTESFVNGDDGGGGQGYVYWSELGSASAVFRLEEAWRTANAIDPFTHYASSSAAALRYYPKYLANLEMSWATPFASSPDGMRRTIWKTWASTADDALATKQALFTQLTMHSGLYAGIDPEMASLAAWLLNRRLGSMGSNWYSLSGVFRFVYGRTDITPASPVDLQMPLSLERHDGTWLLRTGWRNNNDSLVVFNAPAWILSNSAYTNRSPGGFEIYRKGPQVIRQDRFAHDWGSATAGSQNILIFPDRSKTAASSDFDSQGGMRWLTPLRGAASLVEDTPADARGAVRRWLSDGSGSGDVDYVSVDLTRAYDSTLYHDNYNPPRISSYVRQLVYFRPAAPGVDSDRVVVFDRAVTTDTKFEKAWLFHTATTPAINGAPSPGPARGVTGTDGKITYTGATRVTATNTMTSRGRVMNGTTWLTPLLPAERIIVRVGGPNGSTGKSWQPAGGSTAPASTDSHEFESPYGVQGYLNQAPSAEMLPWVGAYRVEIIPKVPALNDTFLNVVEVGDSTASQSPVELVSGGGLVGARVGNRIAVFGTTSGDVRSGSVTVPTGGTYRMLIGDLVPYGNYSIAIGGSTATHTASQGGTLYLDVSLAGKGSVSVNFTGSMTAPPPPPQPPTGLKILP